MWKVCCTHDAQMHIWMLDFPIIAILAHCSNRECRRCKRQLVSIIPTVTNASLTGHKRYNTLPVIGKVLYLGFSVLCD